MIEVNCDNVTYVLTGSGYTFTGTNPPVKFSSADGNIDIRLNNTEVLLISMEIIGAKSIAIFMYDDSGSRRFRDTVGYKSHKTTGHKCQGHTQVHKQ